LIAPRQAFLIASAAEEAAVELAIKAANVSTVKEVAAYPEAASPKESLKIIASNGSSATAAIVNRVEIVEKAGIPKIFTPYASVPEVFIVDDKALEIVEIETTVNTIPLGINALDGEQITFTFEGLENITAKVSLHDALLSEPVLLSETNNSYTTIHNSTLSATRFSLLFEDETGIKAATPGAIRITQNGNRINVRSSGNDLIQSVRLYNPQSRLITAKEGLSAISYGINLPEKGVYVIEITTQNTRSIKKVIN
jgi:hypothetical protein